MTGLDPDPATRRGGWIGPVGVPRGVARCVVRVAGLARGLVGWRWLPVAAVAAGTLPFALSYVAGVSGHAPVTGIALALLVLACVRAGAWVKGLVAIAACFLAHGAAVIAVAHHDPAGAAAVLEGGNEYWERQRAWIATGHDPEYEIAAWAPAHGVLVVGVALYAYASFGATAFTAGVREVDRMNYYVARLIAESESGSVALVAGWHPWSLARGVGFTLVALAVVGCSYERLTGGRALGPARLRRLFAGGVCFLLLDCAIKVVATEPVRAILAANLGALSETHR